MQDEIKTQLVRMINYWQDWFEPNCQNYERSTSLANFLIANGATLQHCKIVEMEKENEL